MQYVFSLCKTGFAHHQIATSDLFVHFYLRRNCQCFYPKVVCCLQLGCLKSALDRPLSCSIGGKKFTRRRLTILHQTPWQIFYIPIPAWGACSASSIVLSYNHPKMCACIRTSSRPKKAFAFAGNICGLASLGKHWSVQSLHTTHATTTLGWFHSNLP